MALLSTDTEYLGLRGLEHVIAVDGGMTCILFPAWPLPPGYDRESADMLIRLQAGYPDVPPDMWWFDPGVRFADGNIVPATEVVEQYMGRSWQRWSRHLEAGQWRPGIDGLESFLALICSELRRCVQGRPQ